MAFQPFGYRFEVRSALSPDAVKSVVRSRKKGWFDTNDTARGWIVGPVICLQWGIGRNAPILLGHISRDELGTRISGRAGYLGSAAVLFLAPVPALLIYMMIASGEYTLKSMAEVAILTAIVSIAFWIDNRDAEPLVRFLRDTVGKQHQTRKARSAMPKLPAKFPKSLSLEVSGSVFDDPATPISVRDALSDIEGGGFIILSSAEEFYLQTAEVLGRYILEKREGDNRHFYRAVRRGTDKGDDAESFTYEETLTILISYGSDAPMPPFLEWKAAKA